MSKVLKIVGVIIVVASIAAAVWYFFLNDSIAD
jgi:hypothetical protein